MKNSNDETFNATIGNTVLSAVHLAPYLPYKLKCLVTDKGKSKIGSLFSVYDNGECSFYDTIESEKGFSEVKPILRPMTMLDGKTWNYENIPVNFLRSLGVTASEHGYSLKEAEEMVYNRRFEPFKIQYILFEQLLKFHFDVFGLIKKGLAIDINTLSVE